MRKIIRNTVLLMAMFAFSLGLLVNPTKANAASSSTKEILLLAKGLNEAQRTQVKNYYKGQNVPVDYVTIKDYKKYFDDGTSSDSELISSVYIKKTNSGGVKVKIRTPENITEIKDFQYESAAVTAGIENAEIEVIAIRPVTGEAALAGVIKAGQMTGSDVTEAQGRAGVNELKNVNDVIKNNSGVDAKKIVNAVNDAKKAITEEKAKNPNGEISINFIRDALNNSFNNNNISIGATSLDKLTATLKQFSDGVNSSNIEKYKSQLTDLANNIKNRIENLTPEQKSFARNILDAIASFFKAIFDAIRSIFN